MKVNNLDYKYAIYGIAKSVPYVMCFEKYKKGKLCDSVFVLADEIDSNHCEKTYVHLSSSDMQNIIAYKRYISNTIKHLILSQLISVNVLHVEYGKPESDLPASVIFDALRKLFYKGETDRLYELPENNEYRFSFINQKLNHISDFNKIVSDYDAFMSSQNLSHTLSETNNTKIVLSLSTKLKNDTVMLYYKNNNISYKIFNSLRVEQESILEYIQSWCK